MYKIIAFDIDGTILPFGDKHFDSKIINMFKELKEKNMITVLCTGRNLVTINKMLEVPNIDYFIGANGTFIYDINNKKMLFDEAAEMEELKDILEFCDKKDINYSISTDKKAYFKKGVPEKERWFWDVFMDKVEPLENIDPKEKTIHQLTIRTSDMNDIDEIEKYLSTHNNKFAINSKWDRGCFISRFNTHKASGLTKLSEILGTTIESIVAFGDGSNDKEMLEQVGYSVAMGNASDELKAISDDVIGTSNNFAVIEKLKEMLIIK